MRASNFLKTIVSSQSTQLADPVNFIGPANLMGQANVRPRESFEPSTQNLPKQQTLLTFHLYANYFTLGEVNLKAGDNLKQKKHQLYINSLIAAHK